MNFWSSLSFSFQQFLFYVCWGWHFFFSKNKLTRKLWRIRSIWQVVGMSQTQHNLEVIPFFRINLLAISQSRRVACIFCSIKKLYETALEVTVPLHIYRNCPLLYSPCFRTQGSSPHHWLFVWGKLHDPL